MNKVKKHSKITRFCRVALLCAAVAVLCVLIFSLAINLFMTAKYKNDICDKDSLGSIEGAEYAIILGCGVYENGEVCDMLRHRLDVGSELYFSGKVQKIVVSGNPSESHNNEPYAMRKYLTDKGIPDSVIFTDNGGFSTYDTMSRAAEVFGIKSAVVVSQRYHLSRAMYIGDSRQISVVGASATYGKYEEQSWYSLREYLARCKDFLAVLFNIPYDLTEARLPQSTTEQSPLPEPTPTPDLKPEPTPTPDLKPEPTPEPAEEILEGAATTDLSVRSGAGTKYSSIGTLSCGDTVTIVGTSGGWHKIKFGEGEGYVSTDCIELKYSVDPSKYVIYEGAVADLFPIAKSYSLPRETDIERIILHFSSAILIDFDDPYNMDLIRDIFLDGGVDAHYVIDRNGAVYCLVPEDRVAYHASSMNGASIGIELLAIGSKDDMSIYMSSKEYDKIDPSLIGYTNEQYASLDALLSDLCERYEIPADREHIAGHDEYNSNKNDPGELFDWERVMDSLNS